MLHISWILEDKYSLSYCPGLTLYSSQDPQRGDTVGTSVAKNRMGFHFPHSFSL